MEAVLVTPAGQKIYTWTEKDGHLIDFVKQITKDGSKLVTFFVLAYYHNTGVARIINIVTE